jgi:Capsule assembly protein Wzi
VVKARRGIVRQRAVRLLGVWGGLCGLIGLGDAADRTDMPLTNAGGFARQWHWTYDAIHQVVLAGLTDRAVLNTKPMSRLEMAKVVAEAIGTITEEEGGRYAERRDVEDTLDRLLDEFQPELAALGVEAALAQGPPPGAVFVKPLAWLRTRIAGATHAARLEDSQGDVLPTGGSGRLDALSRGQLGDLFSATLHPELRMDEHGTQPQLLEEFAKLTHWGVEVGGGRESLWWGPGFHGSMLLSNNAQPFDLLKIGAAEPFTLPSVFSYLGPMKLTLVLGQLEAQRDFPHTKVGEMRVDVAPASFLELGFGRAVQFDGAGRHFRARDLPGILFTPGSDHPNSPLNGNSLFSADVTVRLANVGRYLPLFTDLELYAELGWDDTCCRDIWIPLRPGGIIGLYSPNLLGWAHTELRLEYAASSNIEFIHSIYTSGYAYKGQVLSHFMGTDGKDLYVRLSRWLRPDLLLGLEVDQAHIGPVAAGTVTLPREHRVATGLDLSYRVSKLVSLFGAYRFSTSDNLGSVAGRAQTTHLVRVDATLSF